MSNNEKLKADINIPDIIDKLWNELKCVETTSSKDGCDRDCANCKLLRNTDDILYAYDTAISILEHYEDYKRLKEKETPVKVEYRKDNSWGVESYQPYCPICQSEISKVEFLDISEDKNAERITYCEWCGHALDRSEEK